jgi:hypothetical protein
MAALWPQIPYEICLRACRHVNFQIVTVAT